MAIKNNVRILLRRIIANSFVRTLLRQLSHWGLLPAVIWQRLPVETIFRVTLPDGCSFAYSAIANDVIGRALFWRGYKSWETETIQIFYKVAQRANLVLDIGANTGVFTLLACVANPNCRVISFEPVPRVFHRLQENIKINGWDTQCEVRREAVSDASGSAHFHVPDGDLPTSATLHRQGFRGYRGTLFEVPVTTIDDICLAGTRVDLVKIDVEGFEDKVLRGMQRNLLSSTPTIIVECNPDGPFQGVEAILKMFGYHFFHLRVEGPVAVDKITPDKSGKYRNFLCTVYDDLRILGLGHG